VNSFVCLQARIIEIYGKCEEYMATCHAEFFDECEDMSVFIAEAELPQPSSECTLKASFNIHGGSKPFLQCILLHYHVSS
jgi:hypothetical protein